MTRQTANDDPERGRSAKEIFVAAIELPADERPAFIEASCAGNAALRQRVDALIAAFDQVDGFMSAPTGGGARPDLRVDWADAGAKKSGGLRASGADPDPQSTRVHAAVSNEQAGQIVGRYKLLEPIGEGGFGTVWVAEQMKTVRRKVAIKIVKAGMDTREVLARFEAERQALAVMDHPNVARVFDAGATASGRPYFVMEFVPGVPITTYCDSARLKIRDRLSLFMDVCSAVHHAHQKGVIHRDLKPGNILVTLLDGKPVPKVIDFGIAKATIGKLTEYSLYTEMGRLIGTPEYMAPEQAGTTGLDVDTRADIYSLGVLLYQLLTGTLPFDAATLRGAGFDGLARIIKEQEPPKPSTRLMTLVTEKVNRTSSAIPEALSKTRATDLRTLMRDLRGDLDWIVMKALEKDRTRRYESASAFAADLQRHLTGEPVVAAPPSMAYRVRKFARKHRGPVTAVSTVGAILIGATIGLTAMYRHARQNAREAEAQTKIAKANELRAVEEFERAEAAMVSLEQERQRAELEEYIAKVSAAQFAMQFQSWPEARALLDSCRPNMQSGWEWRYLRSKAEAIHLELPGRFGDTSPDGKLVLTRSNDNTAKLWDVATGQQHGQTMRHDGDDWEAVFSPDGKLVLTCLADKTAKLWDVATGQQLGQTMLHDDAVSYAVFSDDGARIITFAGDAISTWDLSGRPLDVTHISSDVQSPQWQVPPGDARFNFVYAEEYAVNTTYIFPKPVPDDPKRLLPATDLDLEIAHLMQSDPGVGTSNPSHGSAALSQSAVSPDGLRRVTANPDRSVRVFGGLPDPSASRQNPTSFLTPNDRELSVIRLDRIPVGLAFTPDSSQLIVRLDDETAVVLDGRSPEARRADRVQRCEEERAAAPFVDELLAGSTPIGQIETAIRGDVSVPPIRRLARLKVARWRLWKIEGEANVLLERLCAEHVTKARVLSAASVAEIADRRVRESLTQKISDWTPTAGDLDSAAWEIVSDPAMPPERVEAALEGAREAAKLSLNDANILATLGVALYRSGRYLEAIEALEKSELQYAKEEDAKSPPEGPQRPINWAFIAMSHFKLGDVEKAVAAREKLRLLMRHEDHAEDEGAKAFLREAEALIPASQPWWADPSAGTTTQPADPPPTTTTQPVTTQPATSQPVDASTED